MKRFTFFHPMLRGRRAKEPYKVLTEDQINYVLSFYTHPSIPEDVRRRLLTIDLRNELHKTSLIGRLPKILQ